MRLAQALRPAQGNGTTGTLAYLRALAEALPPGAVIPVPREWIVELLEGSGPGPVAVGAGAPDMTVHDVAQRFGRHASTVRGWIAQDMLPGAYRFRGREWRIPASALAHLENAERKGEGTPGAPAGTDSKNWWEGL
jgi:excisionase family DNA binding protein